MLQRAGGDVTLPVLQQRPHSLLESWPRRSLGGSRARGGRDLGWLDNSGVRQWRTGLELCRDRLRAPSCAELLLLRPDRREQALDVSGPSQCVCPRGPDRLWCGGEGWKGDLRIRVSAPCRRHERALDLVPAARATGMVSGALDLTAPTLLAAVRHTYQSGGSSSTGKIGLRPHALADLDAAAVAGGWGDMAGRGAAVIRGVLSVGESGSWGLGSVVLVSAVGVASLTLCRGSRLFSAAGACAALNSSPLDPSAAFRVGPRWTELNWECGRSSHLLESWLRVHPMPTRLSSEPAVVTCAQPHPEQDSDLARPSTFEPPDPYSLCMLPFQSSRAFGN